MKKIYYFAYGSNLDSSRLYDRVGYCKKVQNHNLYGYELVFNVGTEVAYANIIPAKPLSFVEGVLYELTPRQLDILDRYEALYEKNFFITPDNNIGVTYVGCAGSIRKRVKPNSYYLKIILKGCEEHGLSRTAGKVQALLTKTIKSIWQFT